MYFATRSERLGAPVLIWQVFNATARSAIVVSAVSPERCEEIAVYPALCAILMASNVSETEPIWFSLIRIAFPAPSSIPLASLSVFVTNRSSPTSCTLSPSLAVSFCHPSQSSSSKPSSMEIIGYFSQSLAQCSISSSAVYSVPAFGSL